MHAAETAPHSIGKRTRCLFPPSYVHIESCITAFGCSLLTIHEAINRKRVYFCGNQPPEYNSFVWLVGIFECLGGCLQSFIFMPVKDFSSCTARNCGEIAVLVSVFVELSISTTAESCATMATWRWSIGVTLRTIVSYTMLRASNHPPGTFSYLQKVCSGAAIMEFAWLLIFLVRN